MTNIGHDSLSKPATKPEDPCLRVPIPFAMQPKGGRFVRAKRRRSNSAFGGSRYFESLSWKPWHEFSGAEWLQSDSNLGCNGRMAERSGAVSRSALEAIEHRLKPINMESRSGKSHHVSF